MASSVVLSPAIVMSYSKYRIRQKLPQIRAQSYRDEGKSRHVVDANIQVLKERMEEVKMKERLERCLVCDHEQGWNYTATASLYYDQKKRKKELDYISQCVELFCMVGGTIGFTILGCSLCLYLTSLLIHLNLSN
ncbi:PREDICTED: uncharacterized protein LOC109234247 [Nicotiana attenuata]|uniref:Uncharacterized protein n=1 Tax=Nicotiana attenuata TaxID=49451 RepID=A0A1J6HWW6_NICAT|nr:PREDICTED: uncharacterized protein LOC109234247 [Nicotiana attenuata]OIS96873.1 hypothetical protein A4A49_31562 [Nicotiana attenuata]